MKTLERREKFGKWLTEHGFSGEGAEIGVAYGENAKTILDDWDGTMYLIDPYKTWEKEEYVDGTANINFEGALEYAKNHLKNHLDRVTWVRKDSAAALSDIPDGLDFVYVDGNHHNPILRQDIESYWEKVKDGGIFCGHDYYDLDEDYYRCEVKAEVDRFVKLKGVELHVTPECSSWWIRK